MKILVIQTAFIGDVILATALVEKLRKFYPEARIDMLVKKGNEKLLLNSPHINHVFTIDKSKGKFSDLWSNFRKIRKEKYSHVVNLHRFASSGFIAGFSGAKHIIGFDKNPLSFLFSEKKAHRFEAGMHEVDRNLSLIRELTDESFEKPRLYPSESDFESVKQPSEYITIAPASVWFTKQFPAQKWVELMNEIPSDYKIILLGGPDDKELCGDILKRSKRPGIENLAGTLSFLQSAALMKHASMNYVNDSAPMHMASAVNGPVCAVFCSTIPAFGFGPLSDISFVKETHLDLPCRPCGIHGKKACPEGHFKCTEIRIEELVEVLG